MDKTKKTEEYSSVFFVLSAPEGSRTPNLLIRSEMLYPVKLQVQLFLECKDSILFANLKIV